jgi:hypothetical protein
MVRRVLAEHPEAGTLLLVGDLVHGSVQLTPAAVWNAAGTPLAGPVPSDPGAQSRWRLLQQDLRPECTLLARIQPVELVTPYLLDLQQLDLGVDREVQTDPA